MAKSKLTTEERFWPKVDKSGDCWLWTASTRGGYGVFVSNGVRVAAHRLSLEMASGAVIGADQKVCHHCDTMLCVNPAHLFVGTQGDNIRDMYAKGRWNGRRMRCKRGHEFTPENTKVRGRNRECRICRNARKRGYKRKSRSKRPN
jgi:hypothetical protein